MLVQVALASQVAVPAEHSSISTHGRPANGRNAVPPLVQQDRASTSAAFQILSRPKVVTIPQMRERTMLFAEADVDGSGVRIDHRTGGPRSVSLPLPSLPCHRLPQLAACRSPCRSHGLGLGPCAQDLSFEEFMDAIPPHVRGAWPRLHQLPIGPGPVMMACAPPRGAVALAFAKALWRSWFWAFPWS